MPLVAGNRARLVQPTIEGDVVRVKFDEETGAKVVLLTFTLNGEQVERWFTEAELEVVAG